jgi:hypothetical protein
MKTAVVLALFMLTECATAQTAAPDVACIKKPGDTTAKLSWSAPTHYNNNESLPVDNISHYTVAHILPDGTEFVYFAESGTSLEVPLLELGPHRFTVRTHTKDERVSVPSTSVCKQI